MADKKKKKKADTYTLVRPIPGVVGETTFHQVDVVYTSANPDVARAVEAFPGCFSEQ